MEDPASRSSASEHFHSRKLAPIIIPGGPVTPLNVSRTKRVLQVLVAVIYCLLAAGVIFGYAALKPVLIHEGVYRDRCTPEERDRGVRVCYRQELGLNFMFTVAAVVTNVCALVVGALLDRYGPRATSIIGCVLFAAGCLVFALAAQIRVVDAYVTGYLLLALGGPFVFIPAFQLSNTFPAHSGLILSMLTGAFDSSSAVFLVYQIIYERSNSTVRPRTFFLAYLIVPVFMLAAQLFLMPSQSYKTIGEMFEDAGVSPDGQDLIDSDEEIEDAAALQRVREELRIRRESVVSEITELLGPKQPDKQMQDEERKRQKSGVWGALHGLSALEQIRTPWFLLITLFTIVQMTRINYFVATIRPQYEYLLGSYQEAVKINSFFDIALPLGGVIAVPFVGLVLDNFSTPLVLGLLVLSASGIGILGTLPSTWAGFANVGLFVIYRPFYYTAISDYSAKVFGFHTFGKVYGLIMCLGGLFNFSQAALDALTYRVFHKDPIPVNLLLLAVALAVGIPLVAYVWIRSRSIKRERLELEAEGATETLMPGARGF
ncbi:MAG: hypothetical protein M1838_003419 [Thelocarpon superellum]|nr:MAG: hypothetical protein M1838_003419 [Thelocarpon superellum]